MDLRKDRLLELLLLHSFQVREDPPFILASGGTSPYYVNCKPVTLMGEGMAVIGALGYEALKPFKLAAVGGLTLGADPIANAIAMHSHTRSHAMNAFVVRKEPKKHGTEQWLEGDLQPNSHVAVIDDVITTGGSTIKAIERIRAAGHTVEHCLVLVDREEGGREAVEAHGVEVHVLVTRSELLARRKAVLEHTKLETGRHKTV